MRRLDLTNQRFGRLTALAFEGSYHDGIRCRTLWNCKCNCGSYVIVLSESLRNGKTKSCGCFRRETSAANNHQTTHGESYRTPEYVVWTSMKQRCLDQNHKSYEYYGGRGIKVCAEWQASFSDFLADMGRRPSPTHSIDRINNDGNYTPSNCRWATPHQQNNNRKRKSK
jgi:hypothetical protein